MKQRIREELIKISESDYKEFSSKLIPASKPLLGVRLPAIRSMAKELVKGKWRDEISSYEGEYEDIYFEEVMLRGMIIGYGTAKGELEESLELVKMFVPHVDNWSVCDSFCVSFTLAAKHREQIWEYLLICLNAGKEFEVRVGIITILNQYLKYDCKSKKSPRKRTIVMEDLKQDTSDMNLVKYPYLSRILEILNRAYDEGYYAQMAAAWTIAESFVAFPYETMQMLTNDCNLDNWTYNKSLQKICESRIPDEEVKKQIRMLKR